MTTLLLIEDSAFQRRITRNLLRKEGHDVLEASNGTEGLEMMEKHSPHVIMTDLIMPGMNGFELLEIIRERGIDIPVIILSADIQDSTRKRCQELGIVAFLNKPVKADLFREAMKMIPDSSGANGGG